MIESDYSIIANVPLKIAHISDLHNRDGRAAIESMTRRKPDVIAITGDIVLRRRVRGDKLIVEKERNVLPFLSACANIAPTYMCLGNHEQMLCRDDIQRISRTGVKVLDNCWAEEEDFAIGGLTSAYVSKYRSLRKSGDGQRYPVRIPIVQNRDIDLVLSGHAHGGQFRFFDQGVYAPGQGWWPKYTGGIHWGENGRIIISRGMANTAKMIPRLFNPTEIVYVHMYVE